MRLGLLGLGHVGCGVVQLLGAQSEAIALRLGEPLEVGRVLVRNPAKPRPVKVNPDLLTTDPSAVLTDPAIDVVVEVMGGVEPTGSYIRQALQHGKSVVTANKEIMADQGRDLLALAQEQGADLLFEGSVGGAIPILRALLDSLTGSRVTRILGIVNGTTNFILTQMGEEGQDFAQALAEAQRLGYAETDPTADVEGHDAARKLAILSSLAFSTDVRSGDVLARGITAITSDDLAYARRHGLACKLIAQAEDQGGFVAAQVAPAFVDARHPLARVKGAFNAIYVYGDGLGESMFYGLGAGGVPTGSAVLGDVLQAARNRQSRVAFSRPLPSRGLAVRSAREAVSRFYVRLETETHASAAADLRRLLLQHGVTLSSFLDQPGQNRGQARFTLVTNPCTLGALEAALQAALSLPWVRAVGALVQMLDLQAGDLAVELPPTVQVEERRMLGRLEVAGPGEGGR